MDGVSEKDAARIAAAVRAAVAREVRELLTHARAVHRDTNFLVRLADAGGTRAGNVEICTLRGLRKAQWDWFCAYKRSHAEMTVNAVAQMAIRENPGEGGFAPGASLPHYAYRHPSWWEAKSDE